MTSLAVAVSQHLPTLSDAWRPNAVSIKLPFPPAGLFPNRASGKHWTSTFKIKQAYKEDCYLLTLASVRDFVITGDIRVTLIYVMPDKRHRDVDNCLAASKAGLDGMADALKVDDKMFQPVTVYRIPGVKPGCLIVQLETS
jgi:crossover junction endodeoxyribonuclease RusA